MSPHQREARRSFRCFGGEATVIVGGPSAAGRPAQLAALLAQARLQDVDRRLTRFAPGSELTQLNADPAASVPAGLLLRRLAHAVVEAGRRSGGLVDATCLPALERAGYATSRAGRAGLALGELIAAAPAARPAGPSHARSWATIVVDDDDRSIARPAGVRIDGGGLAKGLAADLLARTLADHPTFAVDCAGDIRLGGSAGSERALHVADPFGGPPLQTLQIADGAAATSGIGRRSWRAPDGTVAHHLIDPATGRPAWTGIIQATALAPTALAAEILAKAALLSGAERGRAVLEHGGVLVLADGTVETVEPRARALA